MAKRAQILGSVEEFLYDLCLLVVFFPWYAGRLLLRPEGTLRQFRDAHRIEEDDNIIVSPPVFFLIAVALVTLLLPPLREQGIAIFLNLAKLFSKDHTIAMMAENGMTFATLAIVNGLLIEWRTPGAVTRDSFYLPLFLSLMVAGITLIQIALLNAIMQHLTTASAQQQAWLFLPVIGLIIAALVWYARAQARVYQLLADTSFRAGIGWALLAMVINSIGALMLNSLNAAPA